MPSGESVEPLRFADDDDPDDLGGFSRGKRSYDDDEDEDGGWAINEDHSDRLWDSAEDADDDEEADADGTVVSEGDEEEEEEEEDLFGGGAPRGRRGRPKGSGKKQESSLTGGFGGTGGQRLRSPELCRLQPPARGQRRGKLPVVESGRPPRKPQERRHEENLPKRGLREVGRLLGKPQDGRVAPGKRQDGGQRPGVGPAPGPKEGQSHADAAAAAASVRARGSAPGGNFCCPRAQCPRRGYSQVAAPLLNTAVEVAALSLGDRGEE